MFHCIRWPLALMVFPRLCLIGFNYAQPFLVSSAIAYVSQPVEAQNKNDGYGLIAAAGLIYLGIAVCANFDAKIQVLTFRRSQQLSTSTKSTERSQLSEVVWCR
jgi:hypothetical protein